MKFTVDGEEFEFNELAMTFKDARDIELVTGLKFTDGGTQDLITEAGMSGMQAVVWIAMRRKRPDMRFSDVDDIPVGVIAEIEEQTADPTGGEEA